MLLEVQGLDAFYGESHILHGINLSIASGQGVALLGRNGAGKSALLKSLMGADTRTQGRILLDGQDLAGVPMYRRARRGISLVPEERRIFGGLTVARNIELGRHAAPGGHAMLSLTDLVTRFPMLGGLLQRHGFQLSGGQQQIVAVARGLVCRPRLLLLDEPAEGLAPLIVANLARDIAAAQMSEQFALLLAEQNIDFARACCSHVYVIESGRIVFDGDWAAFDAKPEARSALSI